MEKLEKPTSEKKNNKLPAKRSDRRERGGECIRKKKSRRKKEDETGKWKSRLEVNK